MNTLGKSTYYQKTKCFSAPLPQPRLPAVMPLPWFFAYVSRFENSTKATVGYVYYLCVKNLWRTLALIAMLALTVAVCWLIPAMLPLLPGAVCLSMSYIIEPVFKRVTEQMDDSNADQWYNG